MEEQPPEEAHPPLAKVLHPLSYATLRPGQTVTVGRYSNAIEAAMHASRLEADGITCSVLNANVNGLGAPYSGFTSVEVQVHEEDAERAIDMLNTNPEEMEPADESNDSPATVLDEDGQEHTLVEAGRYESVRHLQSAQTVLASSRVRAFPPKLVKRGDRPAGTGKRFVLRVGEDDLERSQALLEKAEVEDDADDQPRCPKCDSWRVYPVGNFWQSLAAMFGMGKRPQEQVECLVCRHRGSPQEFGIVD